MLYVTLSSSHNYCFVSASFRKYCEYIILHTFIIDITKTFYDVRVY